MTDPEILERFRKQDEYWTGPRFMGLLAVTLVIAVSVIFFIASVRSGDFTWRPFAHDPTREMAPSNW